MSKITFNNQQSQFFSDLNSRVDAYFKNKGIRKTGDYRLYLKSIVLITAAVSLYVLLLTVTMPAIIALLCCAMMGFVCASIGFNVMHDANHGSFSTKKWLNNLMGLSANCLGINAYIWKQKHNIIHHTYTNVDGVDDDIAKMPLLRHCPSQKFLKIHKYQYLYCVPLYGMATLLWTFGTDFMKYINQKIHTTPINRMPVKEHFIFWISKALYVLFYIAIPIYAVGLLPFLLGFAVFHMMEGLTISMVFQLAHVVEDTHFTDGNNVTLKINDEWAVHQVQTTADFATNNKTLSWFFGGLNFQVEHHLFPRISHVHYPAISKMVRECCEKFQLRYIHYPTMLSAIASHFRFIRQLGQPSGISN